MIIAIPLFDRVTALDVVGPYEVLSRLPGADVRFAAAAPGPKRTENDMLALTADAALDDVPEPEVIVVPGGLGTRALMDDDAMLGWLRRAHATSRWTTSVCTGSLLLAELGADAVPQRVVEQGKVITAAGVSAGIDMALLLASRIAGDEVAQAIQLGIEYDPQPPFQAGSIATAPPGVVDLVRERAATFA